MLGNKLHFKTLRQDKLMGKYSKQKIQNKYKYLLSNNYNEM